jgi:hypothetical protein
MNKRLAFFLFVAAFGVATLSEGGAPETPSSKGTPVTAWPVGKTFVRLIDERFTASYTPRGSFPLGLGGCSSQCFRGSQKDF